MVIVRLMGGLGNQMFQYATARSLADRKRAELKLDTGWFDNIPPGDTPRRYELDIFCASQKLASKEEVRAVRGVDDSRWPKVLKRACKAVGLFQNNGYVKEKCFSFDPSIFEREGDIYLDGWWQSSRYFEDIEETIREDFRVAVPPSPPNQRLIDFITARESVSVHFRRGDYVSSSSTAEFHGTSPLEYYHRAVEEIARTVRDPHLLVFSDDPQWVKANFTPHLPVTYVEQDDPSHAYEDLRLMSQCRHHITANSSFSWWGAWLCENPTKRVICPAEWFKNREVDTTDLIPESWMRI